MINTPRPPSVHSTTTDADPFTAFLRPPTSETEHERVDRLRREADAKRVSDNIDEEIKADRERMRKSKQDIRVSFASHAYSFPLAACVALLESCSLRLGCREGLKPGVYLSSRRHICAASIVSNLIRSSYCSSAKPNPASPPSRSSSSCFTTLGHSMQSDFPGEPSFTLTSLARSAA